MRALVRLADCRRDQGAPLAASRRPVEFRDVVSAAALIRSGGKVAGQVAYDAARARVPARLTMFVMS